MSVVGDVRIVDRESYHYPADDVGLCSQNHQSNSQQRAKKAINTTQFEENQCQDRYRNIVFELHRDRPEDPLGIQEECVLGEGESSPAEHIVCELRKDEEES